MGHHCAPRTARLARETAGLGMALDLNLTGSAKLALYSATDAPIVPRKMAAPIPVSAYRALIIYADRTTRLYWRAKLSAIGCSLIDEAATPEDARQLVRFHLYQLVVIDLKLPDLSNWALIKEISAFLP